MFSKIKPFYSLCTMKVLFCPVGKTEGAPVELLMNDYSLRIARYFPFSVEPVDTRRLGRMSDEARQREEESRLLLERIEPGDFLVLLDERGRQLDSPEFANSLSSIFSGGRKRLVFSSGGAYGFSDAARKRADMLLSLSKMVFPHQLVRVIFLEQLYRAANILHGGSYHHV
jgi:23S rRNA (pseudouridine1915-N3)-methyltransferase